MNRDPSDIEAEVRTLLGALAANSDPAAFQALLALSSTSASAWDRQPEPWPNPSRGAKSRVSQAPPSRRPGRGGTTSRSARVPNATSDTTWRPATSCTIRYPCSSAANAPAPPSSEDRNHSSSRPTGINDPWALTYPEQVKIARLLTRPTFLCAATDPDVDDTQRHALATREVEKIIPARDDADPWRATNRVWTAITHFTDRRRDARIYGVPIRDTYYNMLRLI